MDWTKEAIEVWKPVKGYVGLYEVSNVGRVRSLDRREPLLIWGKRGVRNRRGKVLKPLPARGYLRVGLLRIGRVKYFSIHRLVLSAFNKTPTNPTMQGNHKNGIKTDNCISNLEWVTAPENIKHAFKHRLRRGIPHHEKPIIRSDGKVYTSIREAARLNKVSHQAIMNVLKGRSKTCLGYQWTYSEDRHVN